MITYGSASIRRYASEPEYGVGLINLFFLIRHHVRDQNRQTLVPCTVGRTGLIKPNKSLVKTASFLEKVSSLLAQI